MGQIFISPEPLQTAVLFIVFNRPENTKQVFEAIRQVKPPRLYVAADGPKRGHKDEVYVTNLVRKIATSIDWPCELNTLFQDENIGCQLGPRVAIDWFFKNEDYGIILEDDCLPNQSFFWFCQEILNKYKDNPNVMVVSGINITSRFNFDADYFFSRYALMWGWASWRRAWSRYDPLISDWGALKKTNWLLSLRMGGLPFVLMWKSIFDKTYKLREKATWWDYQWIYCCWKNHGMTIAPAKNLVKNIGFEASATHTKKQHPILSNLITHEITFPLSHPKIIKVDQDVDFFISRHWFGVNLSNLTKVLLLKLPGMDKVNQVRKRYFE